MSAGDWQGEGMQLGCDILEVTCPCGRARCGGGGKESLRRVADVGAYPRAIQGESCAPTGGLGSVGVASGGARTPWLSMKLTDAHALARMWPRLTCCGNMLSMSCSWSSALGFLAQTLPVRACSGGMESSRQSGSMPRLAAGSHHQGVRSGVCRALGRCNLIHALTPIACRSCPGSLSRPAGPGAAIPNAVL